jgi:DNA polymerase I-like protein with 3'-5' exonuclease and polymerase domains
MGLGVQRAGLMLVNADAKQLEWVTCVYLSRDEVAMEELRNPATDMHSDNQKRLGLPSRLIAKIFLFRLIFGGSAYSYAMDPDFSFVSNDPNFWQEIIDKFYAKYRGLERWHNSILRHVMETGTFVLPTGRTFRYQPYLKNGQMKWPRTTILNYPVQGLGADLMMVARIAVWRSLIREKLESKFVGTVHDSLLIDSPKKELDKVLDIVYSTWDRLPQHFEALFGVEFDLPCRVEVQIGNDWHNMEEVKR